MMELPEFKMWYFPRSVLNFYHFLLVHEVGLRVLIS